MNILPVNVWSNDQIRIPSGSGFWATLRFLVVIFTCLIATGSGFAQDSKKKKSEDEKEAITLDSQAIESRKLGDHKFACETWEKLIADHPNYSQINNVLYNCGTSYYSQAKFEKAAEKFAATIKAAADDKDFGYLEASYLYLGFSHYSLGRKAKNDESKTHYETAISTFDKMIAKFPSGKYNDQGLMFRGDSHLALNQVDKAAENYQELVDNFPKSRMLLDAHNALAAAQNDLKQFEQAESHFQKYVDLATARNQAAKDDSNIAPVEVADIQSAQMNVADAQLSQALAARDDKQTDKAAELFAKAQSNFESLAGIEKFASRDRCLFQKGFCQVQQNEIADAAKTFDSLAKTFPDSKLYEQAAMEAGRAFYNSKQFDAAAEWFEKLQKKSSKYTLEAAHFHVLILLGQKENEEAARLAKAALALGDAKHPYFIYLKMDYADALYQTADSKEDSIKEYLAIVENFSTNDLAAQALYYATFASYEIGQPKQAIGLANQFAKDFAGSSFEPDVQQVKADSMIQTEDYASAEQIFNTIIKNKSNHPNIGNWIVRRAVSQYFQKKYDAAITGLTDNLAKVKSKRDLALAHYWLSASHFDKNNWSEAKSAAQTCLEREPENPRAAEATLILARSQFQLKETDEAVKTAKAGLENFKSTDIRERLNFRIGEFYDDLKLYDQAVDHYLAVIKSGQNKTILPNCYYSLAWSQLKSKQLESAIDTFTQVIDRFPNHKLRDDAVLGRGMAYRQQGSDSKAIRDLRTYVSRNVSKKQKTSARFELGLAQISSKKLTDAITTFQTLLSEDPESKLADRVHYELAWALRDSDQADEATDQFEKLTKKFPDSPFAPESFFHLAQADYDDRDYEAAIENYQKCIDSTKNKSHAEKATYKLAWSLFQQKKYADAEKSFRAQTKKYADGQLNADGLFMVSECLFRQKKYTDAVTAYKIAAPEVAKADVDKNVKLRTLLHGAQSANKAELYDQAIEFADPIVKRETKDAFTEEAWLEIGLAYKGKKEFDEAIDAFQKSSKPINETGAESYCMIGEIYFEQKKFDRAITEFKKVIYGFGGTRSDKTIQPWQAFAAFEAARCNHVQISGEKEQSRKNELISEAKKMFQHVVDNYSSDRLAVEARKQLEKLKRM